VDQYFLGSGSRPPGRCRPGYVLNSAGPGLEKSWYCVRVVSPVASRPAPIVQAPPPPPPPVITVSPTFQQSFTPQVSPVINAQIQSPGARATGAPTQQASTPQRGSGGSNAPVAPSGISEAEAALREKVAALQAAADVRAQYSATQTEPAPAPEPNTPQAPQIPEAPLPQTLPAFTPVSAASAAPPVPVETPTAPATAPSKLPIIVLFAGGALLLYTLSRG